MRSFSLRKIDRAVQILLVGYKSKKQIAKISIFHLE